MLVDMSGTDMKSGAKTRLVGAIVPKGKQTWFYKLMGPAALVELPEGYVYEICANGEYR